MIDPSGNMCKVNRTGPRKDSEAPEDGRATEEEWSFTMTTEVGAKPL